MREEIDHASQHTAEKRSLPVPPPDKHLDRMAYEVTKNVDHTMRGGRDLDDVRFTVEPIDHMPRPAHPTHHLESRRRDVQLGLAVGASQCVSFGHLGL